MMNDKIIQTILVTIIIILLIWINIIIHKKIKKSKENE